MTAQGYPDYYDIMWAASDRDGRIAVFFSAGQGPIPKSFLQYEDYDQEGLEAYMLGLPERGECITAGGQGLKNEEKLARSGCYIFDWSDVHRSSGLLEAYELDKIPSKPLTLDGLSPDVRKLLTAVALPNVTFGDEAKLDIEAHCECLHEGRQSIFDYVHVPRDGPPVPDFRWSPRAKDSGLSIAMRLLRLVGLWR